jgi:hypothetical protein
LEADPTQDQLILPAEYRILEQFDSESEFQPARTRMGSESAVWRDGFSIEVPHLAQVSTQETVRNLS